MPYPDQGESQRGLAWGLHVELATRVSAVDLAPDQGLLADAVASLHTLFTTARRLLGARIPDDETPEGGTVHAIGGRLLQHALRPFLTRWRPALNAHMASLPPGADPIAHERSWEHNAQLRADLAELQVVLREVAEHLAALAGTSSLLPEGEPAVNGRYRS